MRIGFIGLGNMGAPMAANLVKAGHQVCGHDIAGVSVDGVHAAGSLAEAVSDQDVVITMLPNGAIVRSVYDEIVPLARKHACLVDCSTIDVESARAAHALAHDFELHSVDAPVSGGVAGAAAGTLTFMAGGSLAAFDIAHPLFRIMGQKAVHCGAQGAGQAAKICNNMILGISMIAVCEAIGLADHLGLDRQKLFDVVSTSSGSCWSMNTYAPMPGIGPQSPADNDFRPGFAAELMMKDLSLSQAAAQATGAATPLGAHALELYQAFVEHGGRGRDFSAMVTALADLADSRD